VEGAEAISRMITRYKILEQLHLCRPSLASEQLVEALIKLYSTIMACLAAANRYFKQRTAGMSSTTVPTSPAESWPAVRILKSGLLSTGEFELKKVSTGALLFVNALVRYLTPY